MAPSKSKKRQSGASAASSKPTKPASTTMKAIKTDSPKMGTPKQQSPRRAPRLTQTQKQALIDNLQLEITERARKLRAQYALQAQSLRTRLEIRVHRIPVSLRATTIRDLLEKHSDKSKDTKELSPPKSGVQDPSQDARPSRKNQKPVDTSEPSKAAQTTKKRKSDELDEEKENGATTSQPVSKRQNQPIQNRNTNHANASRRVPPSQILSPKSNNARTFPHSPYKPTMSPNKPSATVRPASPLKPSTTLQRGVSQTKAVENVSKSKPTTSRTASKQKTAQKGTVSNQKTIKRGVTAENNGQLVGEDVEDDSRRKSNASEATNASTTTTIVRNTKKAPMPVSASTAATKGRVAGIAGKFEGISANGKKVAGPKPASKSGRPAVAATGRTLRKR